MSERIEVRPDVNIAGADGDAARGELAALTRWVAAEPAGPVPAGAGVQQLHKRSTARYRRAVTAASGSQYNVPCRP